MRSLFTVLFISLISNLFAFEGVIHGVKTTNGVTEKFDIYLKGDLISIEGEDGQGKYKIIIDRSKENIIVCIDNPAFGNKGYYQFTADQLKREKRFQIISAIELNESKEVAGEDCQGYSLVTDQGSVVMYASKKGQADLTGLSKYMDDPVYELIDSFGVRTSIRKLAVKKEQTSYTVELTEEMKSVESSRFEIPAGYEQYEIKLNSK